MAVMDRSSGGRVNLSKFRRGWLLTGHETAHYYERTDAGIVSSCGLHFKPELRDDSGFVVFEPGSFPLCKRCNK